MFKQFLIIGVICALLGLAHGLVGGLKMPEKAKTNLPIIQSSNNQKSEKNSTLQQTQEDSEETSSKDAESRNKTQSTTEASETDETEFTVEALFEFWVSGQATLVDARTEEEYQESHIPGAVHLSMESIDSGLPDQILFLDPSTVIIVYCSGGECHASHSVASLLMEDYGFTQVFVFEKGFAAWEEAGFEVSQ